MAKFNYLDELKKIVDSKKLVELNLPQEEGVVAYVLRVNEEFITIAEISASAILLAVSTYRLSDISQIKLDSIYLSEFSKMLTDKSLYLEAKKSIESMKDCSFNGFLEAFVGTETLVELADEKGDTFQGKIVSYEDDRIIMDEYYSQYDKRFARTIIKRDILVGFAVNTPRIRILSRVLAEKNL